MRERAAERSASSVSGVVQRATLPEFAFHRPTTTGELLALLARYRGRAALLAGGTDLVPRLRVRERVPDAVIDLKGLPALGGGIRASRDSLRLGALVRVADLARHAVVRRRWPLLAAAAERLGTPQVRERATLGGDLMCGAPWADLALALLALDGAVRLLEGRGTARPVPLAELLTASERRRRSAVLAGVTVPAPPRGLRTAFHKLETRAAAGAPLAAVAVAVVREGGWIRHARIALGNAGHFPLRVLAAESLLAQHVGGPLDVLAAASEAADAARPPADLHASSEYRRELVRVLVRRALEEVLR